MTKVSLCHVPPRVTEWVDRRVVVYYYGDGRVALQTLKKKVGKKAL